MGSMAIVGMISPRGLLLGSLGFSAALFLLLFVDEISPRRPCASHLVDMGMGDLKSLGQEIPRRTYPAIDAAYAREAAMNLSLWKATLFDRTMQAYAKEPPVLFLNDTARNMHRLIHDEPDGHRRFDGTDVFITCPPGQELKRWGTDDGGKWVCGLNLLKSPCMVLSIGGNNNYKFEESVLEATPCQVATFDCTVEGRDIDRRHKFYKKCLGSDSLASKNSSYITITDAAQMAGAHDIALLKMDIEGYEYDILSAWKESMMNLPQQLCLEVHTIAPVVGERSYSQSNPREMREVRLAELALFFNHMVDLGYGIVSREDNPLAMYCSEYTFFRVA